ncbi:hypothetical protein Tco_0741361 [Tanacetum coccineum]
MELYMLNRPHGRMILAFCEKGPLVWPSITVDGATRLKEYIELTSAEAIQVDCDIKAINIILQGLPTEIYALKGDDPIDAINHMMSFLTAVVTSRYPTANNELRTSSNPRQQCNHLMIENTQGNNLTVSVTTAKGRVIFPSSVLCPREKGMKRGSMIKCTAKIALMANLSRNGSDALTESETEITSDSNIIPYS